MADLKVIVKLPHCNYYQKYRYSTEKRSGKKNHDTPMMKVLIPLPGQIEGFEGPVKILIFCVSADSHHVLHSNVLVAKDCKRYFELDNIPIDKRKIKGDYLIYCVPYIYIERTKQHDKITAVKKTMNLIPIKYRTKDFIKTGDLLEDIYKNVRTDVVRLKVCVEIDGKDLEPAFSPIITHHDGGEKVKLNIIKMSESTFQPDDPKVTIDIFTENHGPDIKPDEFDVHVETLSWKSQSVIIKEADILYKRVIMYEVPMCGDSNIEHGDVKGTLILTCRINGLSCRRNIIYAMSKIERKRKQLEAYFTEQPEQVHIKKLCVEQTRGKRVYEDYADDVQSGPIVTDTQFGTSNLLANAMESADIPSCSYYEYQSSQAASYTMLTNNSGSSFQSIKECSAEQPSSYVQQGSFQMPVDVQQPMETHSFQQPMETHSVQQPMETHGVQQPMETHGVQQPMETHGVQQPMETHGVQQPMETHVVKQPMETHVVKQPMETHVVQQPMGTPCFQQPMKTADVKQPMETRFQSIISKSNPPACDPSTDEEASSSIQNISTHDDVCEKSISLSFSPSFSDKSSENDLKSITNLDSIDLVKYCTDLIQMTSDDKKTSDSI